MQDLRAFADIAAREHARFVSTAPFPYIVIDDFLPEQDAVALLAEFEGHQEGWTYYHHVNSRKRGFSQLAEMSAPARAVIEGLHAPEFLRALEVLTGICPLLGDPELDGGGLHETVAGGFLNVHTDFLSHTTRPHWSRQVNLLLFLNRDWQESWAGWLEFWDPESRTAAARIAPLFNRCVIFQTSERSLHGVPAGVHSPPGTSRKSLALYYFRDEGRACPLHPTHYIARPEDPPVRRALIRLDRWLIYGYSALKRYTPLGDRVVSALLRRL